MEGWGEFLVAEVGAAAVLAGLIFVAVSINLERILRQPTLPRRALESLLMLLAVVIICSVLLVPHQLLTTIGIELIVLGIATWFMLLVFDIRNLRDAGAPWRRGYETFFVVNQAATLPYIIAGVWVLLNGASGLYWLVPAVLISFTNALLDAWVLLVEINR